MESHSPVPANSAVRFATHRSSLAISRGFSSLMFARRDVRGRLLHPGRRRPCSPPRASLSRSRGQRRLVHVAIFTLHPRASSCLLLRSDDVPGYSRALSVRSDGDEPPSSFSGRCCLGGVTSFTHNRRVTYRFLISLGAVSNRRFVAICRSI